MSKISFQPNAVGSGTFTIASPNSGTNRTLTLPDETGTVLTSASSIPTSVLTGNIGKVLQMQQVYHTSTTQLTSAGAMHELSTSLRITFTPQVSTSKLLFNVSAPFCCPNSTHLHFAKFYDVTNSATVNEPPASGSRDRVHWTTRVANFDANDMFPMCFSAVADSVNTTARTYTIYHKTEGVTVQFLRSTLDVSGFVSPIVFTIMEISQ
jgi:hypothetical protein